jgi:hypothetical protein
VRLVRFGPYRWTTRRENSMGFTPDDYDAATDLTETGYVTCDACGHRVRTDSLESLPPHDCAERARHNGRIKALDVGQLPANKTEWVPARFVRKDG